MWAPLSPREPTTGDISAAKRGIRDTGSQCKAETELLRAEGVLGEETAKPQDKLCCSISLEKDSRALACSSLRVRVRTGLQGNPFNSSLLCFGPKRQNVPLSSDHVRVSVRFPAPLPMGEGHQEVWQDCTAVALGPQAACSCLDSGIFHPTVRNGHLLVVLDQLVLPAVPELGTSVLVEGAGTAWVASHRWHRRAASC